MGAIPRCDSGHKVEKGVVTFSIQWLSQRGTASEKSGRTRQ